MRLTQKQYEALKARIKAKDPKLKSNKQNGMVGKKQAQEIDIARAVVRIKSFRKRLIDRDNLWGGSKILIDCLKDLNVIQDDSEKYIDLHIEQEKVSSEIDERTEIEVIKS